MAIPSTKHSVHPTAVCGITAYMTIRKMIKGSHRKDLILPICPILNAMMPGRKLGKYCTTFAYVRMPEEQRQARVRTATEPKSSYPGSTGTGLEGICTFVLRREGTTVR